MNLYHLYFSPNGQTKTILDHFHKQLGGSIYNLIEMEEKHFNETIDQIVFLYLPVYAQNIPIPIRPLLKKLKPKYYMIHVTYGGFSYGNVVYEIKKTLHASTLFGYSITPVKHAYIDEQIEIDFDLYRPLIERTEKNDYKGVDVPYKMKHIFASFFEKTRTKINYRIKYNQDLCTLCHVCVDQCPVSAINPDIEISNACIHCGLCVHMCPTHALTKKQSVFLTWYLRKKRKTSVIIR